MTDLQTDIEQVRTAIAEREAANAKLRAVVAELERDLEEFQKRYDKVITPMKMRIDVIRAAIDDLRRQKYGAIYDPDWSQIAPGYVSVEEQYRRAWTKPDSVPNGEFRAEPPTGDEPEGEKIKRLYHELARRFHPDLAVDAAERERRTQIMSQINAAYTARDLSALEVLTEHAAESADQPLLALTLRGLRESLIALIQQGDLLKREHDEMLYGAMMKLKIEDKLVRLKGRDLLREIRAEMESEYDALLKELDQLRAS